MLKPRFGMRMLLAAVAGCAVCCWGCFVLLPKWQSYRRTQALLEEFRKVAERRYYDMHGNEHESIRDLMRARFDATQWICREIDNSTRNTSKEYIPTLYKVLGRVKDPSSIDWIERKLQGPEGEHVFYPWLSWWGGRRWSPGHESLKWLTGKDRWAAFFCRQAQSEKDPERRLNLIAVLAAWFHDRETINWFANFEESSAARGEQLLVAQVYLHEHGAAFDPAKLNSAIKSLRETPEGADVLLRFAQKMRHPAFVPWLISKLDVDDAETRENVQRSLEATTFVLDCADQAAWEAWHRDHGKESRQTWIDRAMENFEIMAGQDVVEAEALLKRAVYRWNDIAALPHIQRLARHKHLHSRIVGWINLSYHPYRREPLRALADQVIRKGGADLDPRAKELLERLEFLDHEPEKWEDQFDFYAL